MQCYFEYRNIEGVPNSSGKLRLAKQESEIVQACPGRRKSQGYIIPLKSYDNSIKRNV
jgi:hypothetical protein